MFSMSHHFPIKLFPPPRLHYKNNPHPPNIRSTKHNHPSSLLSFSITFILFKMETKGNFNVTLGNRDVVTAVLPMEEHLLSQSNLDLLLPPLDFNVFFCYERPVVKTTASGSLVGILKKALAQALVSYYVLAGEVVQNSVGEPEILCNNRGVDFVSAFADTEHRNLNFHNPDECVEGKLVPKKQQGVLCVQVTELKCGGIVVACSFDHRVCDAYSANMFLVTWAEMARSTPISLVPSFRRSFLNPRSPGFYTTSNDNLYVPISSLLPPKQDLPKNQDHLISRIYYIKAESLLFIQSQAPNFTKLVTFCAYLWKMAAASECNKDKICKMGLVVDGRSRLKREDNAAMDTYFGNVLSIPYGENRVEDMYDKPLDWVAEQVHGFLSSAATQDHFLDLIDWVEAHRPEPSLSKIYATGHEGPSFVVSSGRGFPVEKVDFGWGKPLFGSYHFPWGGETGYVMPLPSPVGYNGDWIVYMHMMKSELEWLDKHAGDVFKPLTFDYLKNC